MVRLHTEVGGKERAWRGEGEGGIKGRLMEAGEREERWEGGRRDRG